MAAVCRGLLEHTDAKIRISQNFGADENVNYIDPDEPTGLNPNYVPALDHMTRVDPDFAEAGDMIPVNAGE